MKTFIRLIFGFCALIIIGSLSVSCAKLTMTFDSQGGTPVLSQEITKGKITKAPIVPLKPGHTFSGWYTDTTFRTEWNFAKTKVTGNTTLYAKWDSIVLRVSFNTQGGSPVASQSVEYGKKITQVQNPSRPGYIFSGWHLDSVATKIWEPEKEVVTQDIVLYAGWRTVVNALVYDGNGNTEGTSPPTQRYPFGTSVLVMDNVGSLKRTGHSFLAWNTEADGKGVLYKPGEKIVIGESPVTLYAQWHVPVINLSAGGFHALYLKQDGSVFSFGYNSNGQLGDGSRTSRRSPTAVAHGIESISAGVGHTLLIDQDSIAWAMGGNILGQLGDGTNTNRSLAVKILDSIRSVAAGGYHSLFLKKDGSVWTTGNNEDGQLGDASTNSRKTPVRIMNDGAVQVSAGEYHSFILKQDGTLWAFGWNDYGQLGDGTKNQRTRPVKVMDSVRTVSAGFSHTMVLKQDGSLWAMGYNERGQLGDGTTENRYSPIKILSDVHSVSAGADHTLVIKSDGSLWAMGGNDYGQLGDGSFQDQYLPVWVMDSVRVARAGNRYSMILTENGQLFTIGINEYGQLGDGSATNRGGFVSIL